MSKKKKKKKKHIGLRIFLGFQLFLILLILAGVAYYYVGGYAEKVSNLKRDALDNVYGSAANIFEDNQTSVIYDADGEVLSTLIGTQDKYYLYYDEIPSYVYSAFISVEDRKFYSHMGVDFSAIIRAAWAALRNGEVTQGASTITQQLAKMTYLSSEKTWERKVEEIFIAMELERIYSKDKILEFYVNNCYFANGNYGIEAAAQGYFSKSVSQLSISEIAFLCAIPNSPTYYDPLTNYDNTIARRNRILSAMLDQKYISSTDYAVAVSTDIELNIPETKKHDYQETFSWYCAVRALMAHDGFEFRNTFENAEDEAQYDAQYRELYDSYQQKLYTDGYRIYTSLNTGQQKKLQKSINSTLKEYKEKTDEGIYTLQASAVTIDNTSGRVSAIVGGRNPDSDGYSLNRAYQSFRQPGSSIKPLIVYTPALERGYTPDTIVEDKKIEDGPENADKAYMGKISLRDAVAYSRNTVAWQLFDELTPQTGLEYILNMGFSHIEDDDYRLTSAIGGLTTGVSSLEMASGYASLANDGRYREPTCIVKICNSAGDVIIEPDQTETQVYRANAARMMTSILQSVMEYGTGKKIALDGYDCAGKTGTSNDNKDGWFVGYTYYYTTAVWVGYDTPKSLDLLQGATYPGQIWQDYMTKIHKDLANVAFRNYISYDDESDNTTEDEEPSVYTDDTETTTTDSIDITVNRQTD